MDDNWWGFLYLAIFFGAVALLFIGAMKAQKGTIFWAIRLMMSGATLMLIGAVVVGLFALTSLVSNEFLREGVAIIIIFYFTLLLGILLYIIGFFGFCARWGATGKRRLELLEITGALSAARDQAQRDFEEQTPISNDSD